MLRLLMVFLQMMTAENETSETDHHKGRGKPPYS